MTKADEYCTQLRNENRILLAQLENARSLSAEFLHERDKLKAENEALAKDAARYKLMKSMSRVSSLDMGGNHTYSCQIINRQITGATLDEALDKAIEAAQAEQT